MPSDSKTVVEDQTYGTVPGSENGRAREGWRMLIFLSVHWIIVQRVSIDWGQQIISIFVLDPPVMISGSYVYIDLIGTIITFLFSEVKDFRYEKIDLIFRLCWDRDTAVATVKDAVFLSFCLFRKAECKD
jgi:hypothetical protein